MLKPEYGALKCPSTLDPPPNGIIGTLYLLQILAIMETSSVQEGFITATGRVFTFDVEYSENP